MGGFDGSVGGGGGRSSASEVGVSGRRATSVCVFFFPVRAIPHLLYCFHPTHNQLPSKK